MSAVAEEVRTGDVGDVALYRLFQQFLCVDALRQRHEDEQAAVRARVRRAFGKGRKFTQHSIQLRLVAAADALDVVGQQTAPQVLIHDRLREVCRVDVGGLLADGAFAQDARIARHESDTQTGADNLAERAEENDPAILVEGFDGWARFSGIS